MKVTKRQLIKIISEQIATVNKDEIEDVVMSVLSDEGGAAGLEPIEDALEDLEDDDISLPDEPIEDVVNDVAGVKRHADGDYIDTTKLESKIRVTKRQLTQIIKEEKAKILKEQQMIPDAEVIEMLEDGLTMIALDMIMNRGNDALKREVMQYVMDTSTNDPERVEAAMQELARRNNL